MITSGAEVFDIAIQLRKDLHGIDLWLVGSGARLWVGKIDKTVKDLDFVVPLNHLYGLDKMAESAERRGHPWVRSGFGGYKFEYGYQQEKVVVDIWVRDVGVYLRQCPTAWDGVAVNVGTSMVLKTPEFDSKTNFEITTRWVRKAKHQPYYIEHLKKQGIGDTWTEVDNG